MRGRDLTDTERLLDVVGEAHAFQDLDQYRHGVLELLGHLVPFDSAGYNEFGIGHSVALTTIELTPGQVDTFSALAHQNPLLNRIRQTGDGRPYRISDVVDQSTFRSLPIYQRFYRQISVEYQVAFTLPASAPEIVGIALCRAREDFTAREVGLLSLVRPHLMRLSQRGAVG